MTPVRRPQQSDARASRRRCGRQVWTLLCVCLLALVLNHHTVLAQDQPAATVSPGTPSPVTPAPATPSPAPAPAPAPTPAPGTPTPTPAASPSPAPTTAAPTPAPTPAPSPSDKPTVTPTPKPAESSSNSSFDSDSSAGTTPEPTKKKTKAPTEAPTPSPKPTTKTPPSDSDIDTATVAPATKTPTPTSTKQSDDSFSSDDANNKSSTESSKGRTILMAVIAGVAVLSAMSLLVLCCRRRDRSDSDDMVTPVPILAANNHLNHLNHHGFHPSIAGVDRASGQLLDSSKNPMMMSINTTGYGGLPTTDNGLPKYAVTSPEMPANYRASANQSRLQDFNRRPRSGTASSATSPTGSSQPSFTNNNNSLRYTDNSVASSGFSIRGESDISLDHSNSYASQLSNDDGQPRITTNLKMNRFSRTSSMAAAHNGGSGHSIGDTESFVNHDLTRSVSETPTGEQPQISMGPNNGKTWYKSIESPAEQDRYTTNSESASFERESFEL